MGQGDEMKTREDSPVQKQVSLSLSHRLTEAPVFLYLVSYEMFGLLTPPVLFTKQAKMP